MNDQKLHPEELLPWYVNGTLSATERDQVEAHMLQCAACRSQIEFLRAVSANVDQDTESVAAEFTWQRLRRDMRRLKPISDSRHRWWLPSLAAAAMLVIVVQGVVLFNTQQDGGYGLAGAKQQGIVLQVKFNPEVTAMEIQSALQAVNGEIVAGPGAAGIYRIRLADGDAQIVQSKIDRLRTNRHVIDYIERD